MTRSVRWLGSVDSLADRTQKSGSMPSLIGTNTSRLSRMKALRIWQVLTLPQTHLLRTELVVPLSRLNKKLVLKEPIKIRMLSLQTSRSKIRWPRLDGCSGMRRSKRFVRSMHSNETRFIRSGPSLPQCAPCLSSTWLSLKRKRSRMGCLTNIKSVR